MKWFKLFAFKRKDRILYPIEVFFKMHSWATERKKGKKWVQKTNFLANGKSLNHFNYFNTAFNIASSFKIIV